MTMSTPLLLRILIAFHTITACSRVFAYRLAIVPKETASEGFFGLVREGCIAQAALNDNFSCYYTGTYEADVEGTLDIVTDLIYNDTIDAISVSVTDAEAYTPVINEGIAAGKPIFTFDSDAPESNRLAYVGTDNRAMGRELAKLLHQIRPVGGTYGIVSGLGGNLAERVEGVRERLKESESPWVEVPRNSPKVPLEGRDHSAAWALQMMYELVEEYPDIDAIISVAGLPMFGSKTDWIDFVESNRNVLTVIADTLDVQLELMQKSYVDALVGQLPWAMGTDSVTVTKRVLDARQDGIPMEEALESDVIFGTHQLEVLRIPLQLPEVDFDYHYIGNVAIVGYILCAIVLGTSIAFMGWTWLHRQERVIKFSQPVFLAMICAGTLLMGSAIIPLGIDDEYGQRAADIACMTSPWLITIGFTVSFSALFSKTWRLNKIILNRRLKRVRVTEKDAMWPAIVLLSVNIISLVCWTAIAPLRFVRTLEAGTDPWNRSIGSYGQCKSTSGAAGGSIPYLVVIAVVNVTALVVANFQSYRSRNVPSEFNESTYVALANASFLQALLVCIPILFLTREKPEAYYIVLSVALFMLSEAILLCIFVPKVLAAKEQRNRPTQVERRVSITGLSSSTLRASMIGEDPKGVALHQFQALSWEDKVALFNEIAPQMQNQKQNEDEPPGTASTSRMTIRSLSKRMTTSTEDLTDHPVESSKRVTTETEDVTDHPVES